MLMVLLMSCTPTPEVDYRDKWVGQYSYSCTNLENGILIVKKIGVNQIHIYGSGMPEQSDLTIEHDGTFRGSIPGNGLLGTINGIFYAQDSLCFDYWTPIPLGSPYGADHRQFLAKKIR